MRLSALAPGGACVRGRACVDELAVGVAPPAAAAAAREARGGCLGRRCGACVDELAGTRAGGARRARARTVM